MWLHITSYHSCLSWDSKSDLFLLEFYFISLQSHGIKTHSKMFTHWNGLKLTYFSHRVTYSTMIHFKHSSLSFLFNAATLRRHIKVLSYHVSLNNHSTNPYFTSYSVAQLILHIHLELDKEVNVIKNGLSVACFTVRAHSIKKKKRNHIERAFRELTPLAFACSTQTLNSWH